jgi:hypothetical protein
MIPSSLQLPTTVDTYVKKAATHPREEQLQPVDNYDVLLKKITTKKRHPESRQLSHQKNPTPILHLTIVFKPYTPLKSTKCGACDSKHWADSLNLHKNFFL